MHLVKVMTSGHDKTRTENGERRTENGGQRTEDGEDDRELEQVKVE